MAEFLLPRGDAGYRLAQIDEGLTWNDFVPQELGDVVSGLLAMAAGDRLRENEQTLFGEGDVALVFIDET
ncbi:hypothetical protein D3C71_2232030 [compost metagenome]